MAEPVRIVLALGRQPLPCLLEPAFELGPPLLDLAQTEHVRERSSRRDEVRLRRRAERARSDRERLASEGNRLEILVQRRELAALARCLGKHDALAQDRVAL